MKQDHLNDIRTKLLNSINFVQESSKTLIPQLRSEQQTAPGSKISRVKSSYK